ncbi:MAG: FliM/FliN family flagellar motor switch protein [Planctomycetales bacterium]|nr:FliM/FliN family flagellar motor switch protein [Planctomycetales bacterium]
MSDEATTQATATGNVEVQTPDFTHLHDSAAAPASGGINRFFDVDVTVWAELGRVTMSLGELMQLGAGSVIRLGRSVSAPVELMAQGVRFATGEVVVVDDCFAVRIKEVDNPRRNDG